MIGPLRNFGVYGLVMVASAFCFYLLDCFAISPNSVFRLHVVVSLRVVSPGGSRPSVFPFASLHAFLIKCLNLGSLSAFSFKFVAMTVSSILPILIT